jgi:PII-like signaling protein
LAHYLLQQALKAGVTHASVSLGHMGYTRGAKVVASDVTEIPMTTLPVCLELVAPKPLLEQFVRDHAKSLVDATLMMVDGVQLATTPVSASAPHHVEYVKAGELVLAVDHVDGPADRKSEAAVD